MLHPSCFSRFLPLALAGGLTLASTQARGDVPLTASTEPAETPRVLAELGTATAVAAAGYLITGLLFLDTSGHDLGGKEFGLVAGVGLTTALSAWSVAAIGKRSPHYKGYPEAAQAGAFAGLGATVIALLVCYSESGGKACYVPTLAVGFLSVPTLATLGWNLSKRLKQPAPAPAERDFLNQAPDRPFETPRLAWQGGVTLRLPLVAGQF